MGSRGDTSSARGLRISPETVGALRAALVVALCILWLEQAPRVASRPVVTLPLDILSRPRRDLVWLCVLAAIAATSLVISLLGRRRSAGRPGALDPPMLASALACSLSTAIPWAVAAGDPSPALSVVSGLLGGAGFSVLASRIASRAPTGASPSATLLAGCLALGILLALRACLPALGLTGIVLALCAMPPLAAVLACRFWGEGGPGEAPGRPGLRPVQVRNHLAVLAFCFLGLGLYLGVIGFSNDSLERESFIRQSFLNGAVGDALACLVVAAAARPNPDGPYAMLPVMLGTSALVFVLSTIMAPSEASQALAHFVGNATDSMTAVLAACTLLELGWRGGGRPGPSGAMAIWASALLAGILLGGVLMSEIGFGTVSIVLTAASLLYGAVLCLGLSVRQRDRERFVVVRSTLDMERIARLQARALADELGSLTPREAEILPYLLQHESLDEVAERLGISRNTVKTHVAHLYEKAGVSTRAQLVDLAASMTVNL